MAGRYTMSQSDIAMMPPSTVQAQSIQVPLAAVELVFEFET